MKNKTKSILGVNDYFWEQGSWKGNVRIGLCCDSDVITEAVGHIDQKEWNLFKWFVFSSEPDVELAGSGVESTLEKAKSALIDFAKKEHNIIDLLIRIRN